VEGIDHEYLESAIATLERVPGVKAPADALSAGQLAARAPF